MNILPHKSWHVRTKKNISRVRRDEERAQQVEDERLRRVNLAEHEARIDLLRSKSGHSSSNNANAPAESSYFNLFENFKDKAGKDGEKEVEHKVEQEKWEVKTGIFSYLDGRYKYENAKDEEWYLKSRMERQSSNKEQTATVFKDDRVKQRHDPLEDMKRYLTQMKKSEAHSASITKTSSNSNRTVQKQILECKKEIIDLPKRTKDAKQKKHKKKSKHKKHKHKSKKRQSSSESDSQSDSPDSKHRSKEALIHRLRQERLERENKERTRTHLLLHGPAQIQTSEPPIPILSQKYNSQFNPHIARQNQGD